jgi:hypothetical protein
MARSRLQFKVENWKMERGLMSLREREDQGAYDSKKMYSVGSCPQYEAELYCNDCQ